MPIHRHLRVAAVLGLALALAIPADAQRRDPRRAPAQQATVPTAENLEAGQFIQVEGRVSDGSIMATQFEFYSVPRDEESIEAAVEAIDETAGTLTLAGQKVMIAEDTAFENGDTNTPILFGDIAIGDKAKVKGFFDDGVLFARKVKVRAWEEGETPEGVKIKASIVETDLPNDTIIVCAMTVTFDAETEYKINISE